MNLAQATALIDEHDQERLHDVPAPKPAQVEHMRVYLDFETTMRDDIKNIGAAKFLENADATYIAWAVDDGPVKCREWTGNAQGEFIHDLERADELVAHNMAFDYMCLQRFLDTVNFEKIKDKRIACTRAMCYRLNVPFHLDSAAEHFGVGGKLEMPTALAPKDEWIEYNKHDVVLCRKIYRKTRKAISNLEMRVIHNATMMNVRGVQIDMERLNELHDTEAAALEKLETKFRALTGLGRRQYDKLGAWFEKRTGKRTSKYKVLRDLDNAKFSDETKDAIALLVKCNDNELDKLKAIKRMVGNDGRLRDTLQVNSTITNRWAGKGAHLQNAERGGSVRSCVVAGAGKRLFVADLAQVEVRVGLWCAGMLEACKDIHEHDWYMNIAREIYGKDADKECRRRVKQGVIGAMYNGGVEALAVGINGTEDEAQYLYDKGQKIFAPIISKSSELFEAAIECVKTDEPESVELHNGFTVSFRMNDKGTLIMKLPYRKASIYYREAELSRNKIGYINVYGTRKQLDHRGTLYEHICSSICRELFVEVMVAADATGKSATVYTMHDEMLTEVDDDVGADMLLDIMRNAGKELTGLHLNAEGDIKERWVMK